ncbi:MAG: hypothetical protein FJ319_04180 [SAR202 cluster bacterium]|nr:hypothetical protein [SAR202 cluster bacterium]
MSLPNSTPGPWAINEKSPHRITGPKNETIATIFGGKLGIDTQRYNGRLVSLSWSMYDLLSRKAAGGDKQAKAIIDSIKK